MLGMANGETKAKRLPEGVRLGKDGRFMWELDRKREDGSRFRKAGSGKTAADAGNRYKAAVKEFESGSASTTQTMTVGEWADYCLASIFPVAPSRRGKPFEATTVEGYAQAISCHIKPLLGDILLTKLTAEHVDAAMAKITGQQSKIKVKSVGSKLFELAIHRRKVTLNPFKIVQLAKPRTERHENGAMVQHVRILTKAEEQLLLTKALEAKAHAWIYGGILLGLRLGMRPGEILGLEWRNVDFKRKTLQITQQRQRVTKATRDRMGIKSKGGLLVVDPKTDSGFRTIPLPESVLTWLTEERARNTTPYILPNDLGNNPKEPRKYKTAFQAVVQAAKLHESKDANGMPLPVPTPHDLRHTFCTRMANDYKVPVQILAVIAGHADIKTTLTYYVHADTTGITEAMANIP